MEANISAIFESLLSWMGVAFGLNLMIKYGSNIIDTNSEMNNPRVIIHPKSITGLMSQKINDKNANAVVKTAYNIGVKILVVVR